MTPGAHSSARTVRRGAGAARRTRPPRSPSALRATGSGCFLPYFREDVVLSTTTLGFIASRLYAGYLIALSAVGLLSTRIGPRPPAVIGVVSAGPGMGLVALATNAVVLAAGVVLAGTGAGWTWAPFNDATEHVTARSRDGVLSVVNTGTMLGILAAGVLALAMGDNRRAAWTALAVVAGAAVVPNLVILPDAPMSARADPRDGRGYGAPRRRHWRWWPPRSV